MGLRLINGKPGSGKSCFCCSLILRALSDWVCFDIKNGEIYPRILYTNIPLDLEAINEQLTSEIGTKIDVSEHVEIVDDTFFENTYDPKGKPVGWWEKFPEKSMIVIDEVHHYLPAGLKADKEGKELAKSWVNYVSTHRHRQHDLIFLTQHLNNITPEVKRMAEVIYEVLNIKNTVVGIWPFIVQMSDIDAVREAWGYPVQLAHIKRGVCEASTVVYDKNHEVFILSPSLFKLYRSHTMSDEALDRPSLKLGKIGSVVWLARKYFTKFVIWAIIIGVILFSGKNLIAKLPQILSDSLKMSSAPLASPADSAAPVVKPEPFEPGHFHVVDPAALPVEDLATTADIIGFVKGGVITKKGILKQNDHILVNGEKDFVQNVDVLRGILYLGSGKKVQK